MDLLDRVLLVENNTITIEAGAKLSKLYSVLLQQDLALPSIPNIDSITVGGAVSNAVHGTCKDAGTICDFVEELQLVVYRNGKSELIKLRR